MASGRDDWGGADIEIQGGATYRFALVVDCGKCFDGRELRLDSELRSLVETTLDVETYEVADLY